MALPTGFPPAWFRLEDGCLMCSATAAILKVVSAAGFAPAVTRSQAGHVAATPRAVRPGVLGGTTGDFVSWGLRDPHTLNLCPAVRIENWRTRRELHPQPSCRQRVAPLLSYESKMACQPKLASRVIKPAFVSKRQET